MLLAYDAMALRILFSTDAGIRPEIDEIIS